MNKKMKAIYKQAYEAPKMESFKLKQKQTQVSSKQKVKPRPTKLSQIQSQIILSG